jgi:hypothetical protein
MPFMKKAVIVVAGAVALLLTGAFLYFYARPQPTARPVSANGSHISVLFIGNSYTYTNSLPAMVSAIAESLGDRVDYDMAAPGGYTLQQHAKDADTLAKIRSKPWDFVVLQEQSLMPAYPDASIAWYVTPAAKQLVQAVRDAHGATKLVFFETWGRQNGDQESCKIAPAVCDYGQMQTRLDGTYEMLADVTSAALAPVGAAWGEERRAYPGIGLYQNDGSHPSRAGTYLAACVFYMTLFHKPVVGAATLDLAPSTAAQLQDVAQQAVAAELKRKKI